MPLPLILLAGSGLSTTAVGVLVTTAVGIGSGIGYGMSFLFGKQDTNKPQPKKSMDKQSSYIKERDELCEQKERLGLEKANHAKTVLKKTKKKTTNSCMSVHKASKEAGQACDKIENATKNVLDANRFFSQTLPNLQENTEKTQDKNAQLLEEIARLNALLDEKVTKLDKVSIETGKLKNTVMAQTDEIMGLKGNVDELKQKVMSQDKIIETMEVALYQATQRIYFLKEAIEKDSAELNNSAPTTSII